MKRSALIHTLTTALLCAAAFDALAQDEYRVDRRSQWSQWQVPEGTAEISSDGSISLRRFDSPHNAAVDAGDFLHETKERDIVAGGIWNVGTDTRGAANIIDGRSGAPYWRPQLSDELDRWFIEIDLGRVVPATSVRLRFPDEEGARPLREFRVYGSDGRRESQRNDIFSYQLLGGTTKTNVDTLVEFTIGSEQRFRHWNVFIGQPTDDADVTTDFFPLQYVRVIVDAQSEDAALAELEVLTFGENINGGTVTRGGFIDDASKREGRALPLLDGDVNRVWTGIAKSDGAGAEWLGNLGATFWINRLIFIADKTEDMQVQAGINSHRILISDGRAKPSRGAGADETDPAEQVRAGVDFDLAFEQVDANTWSKPLHITYQMLPFRRIRHLTAVWPEDPNAGFRGTQTGAISQVLVMTLGHVAQMEMTSGFIDLGGQPKVLRSLEWEADLPADTYVRARTRSGNTKDDSTLFFDKNGKPATEKNYRKWVDQGREVGDTLNVPFISDWSPWSNDYLESGQEFLSPSPRQFVEFQVVLGSDDPDASPTLHSLALQMSNAFVAETIGTVEPREALQGIAEKFTYRLVPDFEPGDNGFDRLLVKTPSAADRDSVAVRIGGSLVDLDVDDVFITRDSLLIELPRTVRSDRDAIDVEMFLTITENPFRFEASMGNSTVPGVWQSVDLDPDPVNRFSTTVFLPMAPANARLIGGLSVSPAVMTPNADGVGDEVEVAFTVSPAGSPTTVRLYSLGGGFVKELEGVSGGDGSMIYTWAGVDAADALVPPGSYLCEIKANPDAGSQTVLQVIAVAY